jgi:hypothetical protein
MELSTRGCQAYAQQAARRIQFIVWIVSLLPAEKIEAIPALRRMPARLSDLRWGCFSPTLRRG